MEFNQETEFCGEFQLLQKFYGMTSEFNFARTTFRRCSKYK